MKMEMTTKTDHIDTTSLIDLGLDIDTNYSKYKKGCINQHLGNIRSSIDEKGKQH